MNPPSLLRKRLLLYSGLGVALALTFFLTHRLAPENDILELVRLNDIEGLRVLLKSQPVQVHSRDKDRNTPLHWAVLWNHSEFASILLSNGAPVNAINKRGKTPLHWAATCGNEASAELLLAHGADVHARDMWGQTPLHSVFVIGWQYTPSLTIAARLLEHGADINARDVHDRTPLQWAALSNHPEAARFLLAKGAELDIFAASALGELNKVAKMIDGQPALACTTNVVGTTPLHYAASEGRMDVAALLLESGADINARDREGITPLHGAAALNRVAMTQFLLEHAANLGAVDNEGQTPLNYAVQYGRVDVAEMLYAMAVTK